jgi:hypothetical protein
MKKEVKPNKKETVATAGRKSNWNYNTAWSMIDGCYTWRLMVDNSQRFQ